MQATEPSPEEEPPRSADETPLPVPAVLLPSAMELQTFFLGGLFAIAVLAALHVASAVILPIVLAFVLRLLLQLAVGTLERAHVPRSIGAFVVIFLAGGLLSGFVAVLSVPAASWAQRLPEGIPRLEAHLVVLKRPIDALQHLIE